MRSIIDEMRRLGCDDAQIAKSTMGGKPLLEAEAEKKKAPKADPFKSKIERYYSWRLDDEKAAGNITRWLYEALKFRIAFSTMEGKRGAFYTPDFNVWYPDGSLEIIEIKGFLREAARVRFMACQSLYPKFRWRMISRTKDGAWIDIL